MGRRVHRGPRCPLRRAPTARRSRGSSTPALAGEGRAAGIARASVVGVELHMHPDVGVCSIGYEELIAALLLRQQRGHAVQPAPGLWNGRSSTATSSDVTRRPPSRRSRSTTWRVLAGTRLTLADAWDDERRCVAGFCLAILNGVGGGAGAPWRSRRRRAGQSSSPVLACIMVLCGRGWRR